MCGDVDHSGALVEAGVTEADAIIIGPADDLPDNEVSLSCCNMWKAVVYDLCKSKDQIQRTRSQSAVQAKTVHLGKDANSGVGPDNVALISRSGMCLCPDVIVLVQRRRTPACFPA